MPPANILLRNAANVVSILGVLPLCVLFCDLGYQYLIPLIVFNNVMDDLDGVLAVKLDIKSKFGAMLDNVCDTISHSVFAMVIGMYYFQQADDLLAAVACVVSCLAATGAIIVRTVIRLDPVSAVGAGSPTNELIRHVMLLILLSRMFEFDATSLLIAAFLMHTFTMLVPFQLPYLIRRLSGSAFAIGMVNASLVVAWLIPYATPVIAAAFFGTYFASVLVGLIGWMTTLETIETDESY